MRSLGSTADEREYKLICVHCGEILAITRSDMKKECDRLLLPKDSSCQCMKCGKKIFFQKDKLEPV